MAAERSTSIFRNTFILSPLDTNGESPDLPPAFLEEACYLYIPIPFQGTHILTVSVSVVPFSIPNHRGQIFYHAEASYAECCHSIDRRGFMPTLISTTEKLYSLHVRHHYWRFGVDDLWKKIEVPGAIAEKSSTCFEVSAMILEHLAGCSKAMFGVESRSLQVRQSTEPIYLCNHTSSSDEMLARMSESSPDEWRDKQRTQNAGNTDKKKGRIQEREASLILDVAEEFLRSFQSTEFLSVDTSLHKHLLDVGTPKREPAELHTQAFRYCASMVMQAKEQIKHATFTRFLSLCFFLIWEVSICKIGKAGARVINLKMREVGFEGPSRSLKSLRDETVFINQLVASVEANHGIGVASLVLYHIFDSTNYHLIRLMNRYSTVKKGLAIRRICEHLDVVRLRGVSLPVLRIHELLKQCIPSLDENEISKAIGYSPTPLHEAVEKSPSFLELQRFAARI